MNTKENAIIKYFQEAKEEIQKVVWPSKKQVINNTWLVIGISLSVAVFIGIVDYLLNLGISTLVK